MSEEPFILICAPADFHLMTRGSSVNYHCGTCNGRVVVSPSGQRRLAENEGAKIQCSRCYFKTAMPGDEITFTAETIAEAGDIVPNTWKDRN